MTTAQTSPSLLDLRGLWVPIVTPFDQDGEVDVEALGRLASRILDDGAVGIVALGTTGEPATLAADERRNVVDTCDRACREAGRTLIVGAGTNSTRGTIDEIEHLTAGTSAAAALVVVPYYTRPSEAAVVEHFVAVADASPVPIVAYNVPYRTGRGLGSTALLDIGAHPRVVGLKQAVDHAGAAELAAALLPIVTIGFGEPSPAVWKGLLARHGEISTGELRRPMTPASADTIDRLADVVEHLTQRSASGDLRRDVTWIR